MVVVFDIIKSVKIIDKEISGLDKKSDKEIDNLYAQEIRKADQKVNLLYQMFEKHYKNKLFISELKSILNKHKLPLDSFAFMDETDYITNLGYNQIKEIGKGGFGTVYLCKKNNKKYAIKMQRFFYNPYAILEDFIKRNINEYDKLKKLNKYSISPKVYDIFFILNENTMQLYSLIVMQHIQGITLQEYKDKKGKLDDVDKKKINDKITKLHKLGIYHSDLHSYNIIVVKKGKKYDFIFIDFGEAQNSKNMNDVGDRTKWQDYNNYDIGLKPKLKSGEKKLYIILAKIVNNGAIDVIS
jgi:serine/threonine protein kinase